MTKIVGTLHGDVFTFTVISRLILLRMRNFTGKFVEKIKTRMLCSITFFFGNRSVYEIMWKNIVVPDRPQITIWRMRIAYWTRKTTDTHTEYETLIAFPREKW